MFSSQYDEKAVMSACSYFVQRMYLKILQIIYNFKTYTYCDKVLSTSPIFSKITQKLSIS